jgi:hypothetical protein
MKRLLTVILGVLVLCSCASALQDPVEFIPGHRINDEGLRVLSVYDSGNSSDLWEVEFPYLKVRVSNDSPFRVKAVVKCRFYEGGQIYRNTTEAVTHLMPREIRRVRVWYEPSRWGWRSVCSIEHYRPQDATAEALRQRLRSSVAKE